jgi:hypothetical protein
MTLFAANEETQLVAAQSFKYDNYSGCQYSLERIDVNGKCGLACVEEQEHCGLHARILLPPVYEEIRIRKISSPKAIYDRYAVFANGDQVGDFTMVLNSWVPRKNP